MNCRTAGLLLLTAPAALAPCQDEGAVLRAEVDRLASAPAAGFSRRDCQRLVQRLVGATALPLRERFDLLGRVRTAVRPLDAEADAYAAQAQARMAFQLNEFGTAVELCKVAAGSSSAPLRALALEFLFNAALLNGDLVAAWPYLERYAESASPLAANLARCELLLRVGMIRAASVVLDQIERAEPAGKQLRQCRCLRLEELLATEQFEDARSHAEAMLGDELPADVKTRVLVSRAFATARLGRADEAEAMLRLLLDDASTGQYLSRIRADLALLRLRKGDAEAAVAPLLGPAADSPPGQLDDWSLAARSRLELLRWRAGDRDRLQELHVALQARHEYMLQQWRSTPELSAGVAFLQWSVRRELMVCLCAAEVALGGEGPVRRCLDHLLAADACGSLARRHGLQAGSHEELRRLLPPGGVLLWFLPAPCGSAVFAITAEGERMLELPADVQLRSQVRALREQMVDETRLGPAWAPALQGLTQPLGDWLWQPALRECLTQNARVTVLGRELLTGLPFEFLPSPADGARPLGLTHAIDYVPSATLAVAALQRGTQRPASGAMLQVLAVTELDAATAEVYGDCAVPLTEAQLHEVAAAVDPGRVGVATAVDAAALRTACEADCLVVFAHGRRRHPRDGTVGELARHRPLGIVLRDGFFGVERLEGLARVPSVVVLASCGTARSGVDRGEDGQQFGAAWLAAGARCVLSAEGDLELEATLQLVREFVSQLTSGIEPAEALRRARTAVASQKGHEHPALSCALRLDRSAPAVLVLPARSRSWLALALALGGAAVAGLWLLVARQKRRGV